MELIHTCDIGKGIDWDVLFKIEAVIQHWDISFFLLFFCYYVFHLKALQAYSFLIFHIKRHNPFINHSLHKHERNSQNQNTS